MHTARYKDIHLQFQRALQHFLVRKAKNGGKTENKAEFARHAEGRSGGAVRRLIFFYTVCSCL